MAGTWGVVHVALEVCAFCMEAVAQRWGLKTRCILLRLGNNINLTNHALSEVSRNHNCSARQKGCIGCSMKLQMVALKQIVYMQYCLSNVSMYLWSN